MVSYCSSSSDCGKQLLEVIKVLEEAGRIIDTKNMNAKKDPQQKLWKYYEQYLELDLLPLTQVTHYSFSVWFVKNC